MINRGYSKDSTVIEDGKFSWVKEIDIERYPEHEYFIHLKAEVDKMDASKFHQQFVMKISVLK